MRASAAPIPFAGFPLGKSRHVGAFNSDDEESRVLLPFIKDGLERGDKFDKEQTLEAFQEMASGNAKGRLPVSRIVWHMEWAAHTWFTRESNSFLRALRECRG